MRISCTQSILFYLNELQGLIKKNCHQPCRQHGLNGIGELNNFSRCIAGVTNSCSLSYLEDCEECNEIS